jgi:hypothetical protein
LLDFFAVRARDFDVRMMASLSKPPHSLPTPHPLWLHRGASAV